MGWEVKKTALEERLLSKQLKGFPSKRNLKLPGKSHKKDKENRRRFKILAKKVADMCSEKGSRSPAKHKTFQQYTRQHQARVKKTVEGTMSHKAVIPWFII